jgi:hypothetical protein
MAVPNYTYLKMKMPGPKGVITVGSSIEHAFDRTDRTGGVRYRFTGPFVRKSVETGQIRISNQIT